MAIGQLTMQQLHICTAYFDFTTAQIEINRTLKYALGMWMWQERISWMEHRTNEAILKIVDEKRSLIGIIRSRQRNWLGNIMRGDSILRTIIVGRMEGKKKRGRPRMMLLVWMMKEVTGS